MSSPQGQLKYNDHFVVPVAGRRTQGRIYAKKTASKRKPGVLKGADIAQTQPIAKFYDNRHGS